RAVGGKVRLDGDGEPLLKLSDQEGKASSAIGFGTHGEPGLTLSDQDGKPRALIAIDTHGEPALTLFDREGKTRAVLGSTELQGVKTGVSEGTAESSFVLFDKEENVIFMPPAPWARYELASVGGTRNRTAPAGPPDPAGSASKDHEVRGQRSSDPSRAAPHRPHEEVARWGVRASATVDEVHVPG